SLADGALRAGDDPEAREGPGHGGHEVRQPGVRSRCRRAEQGPEPLGTADQDIALRHELPVDRGGALGRRQRGPEVEVVADQRARRACRGHGRLQGGPGGLRQHGEDPPAVQHADALPREERVPVDVSRTHLAGAGVAPVEERLATAHAHADFREVQAHPVGPAQPVVRLEGVMADVHAGRPGMV
ncbi:MAG: hypothetical protein ACK559_26140, partial [bacterium]